MTSKSTRKGTTLEQFEHAGKPTSIGDVETTASDSVIDAFDEIQRFKTSVNFNDRDEALLVGRSVDQPTGYRLYHQPETPNRSGLAGSLMRDREFNYEDDDKYTIGFSPAGDTPQEETVVVPVEELTVTPHDRTDRLDGVLDEIRTSLTDSDWTGSGRTDTGYGEWISAVNELASFIRNLDDCPEQFPAQAVQKPKIMHAIARYPLSAEDLLAQAADCLEESLDDGLHDGSPEALRTILFRYADQKT